jgi:hypothetical protein
MKTKISALPNVKNLESATEYLLSEEAAIIESDGQVTASGVTVKLILEPANSAIDSMVIIGQTAHAWSDMIPSDDGDSIWSSAAGWTLKL